VKIIVPIATGASSYNEKIIEGYITNYEEAWELTGKETQEFTVRVTVHEFDVDSDNSL